jgi:hypothetical protein
LADAKQRADLLEEVSITSVQRVEDAKTETAKEYTDAIARLEAESEISKQRLGGMERDLVESMTRYNSDIAILKEDVTTAEKKYELCKKSSEDTTSRFDNYRQKTDDRIRDLQVNENIFTGSLKLAVSRAVGGCCSNLALRNATLEPGTDDLSPDLQRQVDRLDFVDTLRTEYYKNREELNLMKATRAATECAVCLTRDADYALGCGHMYCKPCVDMLKEEFTDDYNNIKCPTCRVSRSQPPLKVYAAH